MMSFPVLWVEALTQPQISTLHSQRKPECVLELIHVAAYSNMLLPDGFSIKLHTQDAAQLSRYTIQRRLPKFLRTQRWN